MPGVKVYGTWLQREERQHTAVVSINIGEEDSSRISDLLWEEYGICVRAGAHCAPLLHEALGTVSQGAVRFSFSWFNTEEEADAAAEAVRELACS